MNRRTLLTGMLTAGAATAATVAGAAVLTLPAVAQEIAPAGISPRMAHLIAEFARLNSELYDVDFGADLKAWDRAALARGPALDALVYERPANLLEFAAKMSALAQTMAEEDSELHIFRRLAEDATLLAGTAK